MGDGRVHPMDQSIDRARGMYLRSMHVAGSSNEL
jgi:hypothetical protein